MTACINDSIKSLTTGPTLSSCGGFYNLVSDASCSQMVTTGPLEKTNAIIKLEKKSLTTI